jgi:4-hydroxybenzoate polyprenyltransferase
MAFAAVRGGELTLAGVWHAVPPMAWGLLLSNLFWVLAYDTEYAMVDRDDDLRIGMKTSAITLGERDVPMVMGFYAVYLLSWGGWLASLDLHPVWMAFWCAALAQAVWHYRLIRRREREDCFKAFRLNHWMAATLFAGLVLGSAVSP